MKVNELRIGNYINYEATTHIITGILKDTCISEWIKAEKSDPYIHSYNEINPIPISEEWLLKFGFEKKMYQHLTLYFFSLPVLSHGHINYYPATSSLELGTTTGYNFGRTEISYIHQLQNLYFSLTGTELTIKEDKI